ncbi:O-antigen ligase [uncultured Aliiroseovarius sp.]|uniref:O-antigen ligase family protein n=1 Tax=uncultured Aliiroseovarius sp. TaxID=1658783 RepID=UPI002602ACED|nr:O-antigen ligase family protein [uncultured Aliiroseovarius sp.]
MSNAGPISAGFAPNRKTSAKQLELYLAIATVALSPMNYLRLDVAYFTASDLFGFMTLIFMLLNRTVPLRFYGPTTSLWHFSFILFVGGLLLSSIAHGDPVDGLIVSLQYFYSLIIIPIIIACRRLDETFLLMRVLIYSIAAIMLHGIYLVTFVPDASPRLVSGSGRLRSLLERENAAGAMTAIAITFSLYLRLTRRFRLKHFAPTLVILLYGLMLTGSNTGFGATVLGASLVLLLVGSFRTTLITVGLGGIFIAITLLAGDLFLPEVFQRRVLGALSTADLSQAGTFSDRAALIQEAFQLSNDAKWLGFGANQYRIISHHGAPVHNTYLLILLEGGIMSLLGMCGLFFSALALGIGAYRNPESRSRGVITLVTVILFILVLNAFAHFYARFWHVPLAIAISLSLPRAFIQNTHSAKVGRR